MTLLHKENTWELANNLYHTKEKNSHSCENTALRRRVNIIDNYIITYNK